MRWYPISVSSPQKKGALVFVVPIMGDEGKLYNWA